MVETLLPPSFWLYMEQLLDQSIIGTVPTVLTEAELVSTRVSGDSVVVLYNRRSRLFIS